MTTDFYACVDRRSLLIENRTFLGGIVIHFQPTYGRVLFTTHDAVIQNNIIIGDSEDADDTAGLTLIVGEK